MNNSIIILCSSGAKNRRVISCCAWCYLCHDLLQLHFADVERKAQNLMGFLKVHTWSHKAQATRFISPVSDQGSFLYCRWRNPTSSPKSSLGDVSGYLPQLWATNGSRHTSPLSGHQPQHLMSQEFQCGPLGCLHNTLRFFSHAQRPSSLSHHWYSPDFAVQHQWQSGIHICAHTSC